MAVFCLCRVGVHSRAQRDMLARAPGPFWSVLRQQSEHLLAALYERHSRRPLCPSRTWTVECKGDQPLVAALMVSTPFMVPFPVRLSLWNEMREAAQRAIAPAGAIRITVSRDRIFETGYATLNRLGPRLKQKVCAASPHAAADLVRR